MDPPPLGMQRLDDIWFGLCATRSKYIAIGLGHFSIGYRKSVIGRPISLRTTIRASICKEIFRGNVSKDSSSQTFDISLWKTPYSLKTILWKFTVWIQVRKTFGLNEHGVLNKTRVHVEIFLSSTWTQYCQNNFFARWGSLKN